MAEESGSEGTKRIRAALRSIPRGRVSTYGAVGMAAGYPNGARQVVRILHASASSEGLPWHRVLRKDGSIALPEGGGFELQKALLESEGVEVDTRGRVDLAIYEYRFLAADGDNHGARSAPNRKGLGRRQASPFARHGRRRQ